MTDYSSALIIEAAIVKNDFIAFRDKVQAVVEDAITYVLDGETDFDELEAVQKTIFGTAFEKRFVRAFDLPRKKRGSPHPLDTIIAGIDVDIKCTLCQNWMIPPEAVGQWCLLVKVDPETHVYTIGILRADEAYLNLGKNRDDKRSVSKAGRAATRWIKTAVAP